jgi:DNA helicase-2/ATP-dependent DNA helicase PcrA
MMDLSRLNHIQKQAVTHTQGPCMVVAGAGSGKTSVLTYRIAHLLEVERINPHHILALTFTNKAANEMRQRIENIVGSIASHLWLGTFHSIFAKLLRREAGHLGYPRSFTIYDTEDSKALLRSIIKEMQLDDQVYRTNAVLARISNAKNRLLTAQMYAEDPSYMAEDHKAQKPHMGDIFLRYSERCLKAGAMDFDDLLLNTHLLLDQHQEICQTYQGRFRYVLIDEFQDTNMAQYTIVKCLALLHQNICVVGDDAQSIYAFRGADIHNILHFERDFVGLNVVKLEQNYRSTQQIVCAANSIIRHNKAQLHKKVWTDNEVGEPISLIRATTDMEEGRLVAASIFEARVNHKLHHKDFAVLYRTNSQSRTIEEALRKNNLPYRVVGGVSFYQRREVKDLLAYLRLLVNPNDESALKRVINLPKRGIGPTSVEKMVVAATDHAMPLWEVVCSATQFLGNRVGKSIEEFAAMMQHAAAEIVHKDAYTVASHIAKRSGLLKSLYADKTIEGLGRYENVQELLNGIKEFTADASAEDISLSAFLQEVALATSNDDTDQESADQIVLMTIHAAKGLEFPYVYVVGMEEDLFPSPMMLATQADLEEERRLFYVALTRAQRKVFLTYALSRYRFGRLKHCDPSRFLEEIDPAYLQTSPSHSLQATDNVRYARQLVRSVTQSKERHTPVPSNNYFPQGDVVQLEQGMQVLHPKFGRGVVRQLDAVGASRKATVYFSQFGEKTLLLSFAKLRVVNEKNALT